MDILHPIGYLSRHFDTIAGLLTLGLRFMPVIPSQYFYIVDGFALLLIIT